MTRRSHTLTLDRILDASADALYQCWTRPILLEQWFCPKPWQATDAIIDAKIGGEFSCVMMGPDNETFPNAGVFLDIIPQRRLVTTDAFRPGWIPADRAFMVSEISFEPLGDGRTRYVAKAHHWTEAAKLEHEAMGFLTVGAKPRTNWRR
ncbi:MAG: SRPBCC domain-containing protein [Litorimonas sp.]